MEKDEQGKWVQALFSKNKGDLNSKQHAAINLLASGHTITEAAEVLGKARNTMSRWVNHHPLFQAALKARLQEQEKAPDAAQEEWGNDG